MDPETGLDAIGFNVGIRGREIAVVTAEPISARTEIDAAGRVVAPGFIDVLSYEPNPYGIWRKAADGVTTNLALHGGAVDVASWYRRFEDQGAPINFGTGFFYNGARGEMGIGRYRAAAPREIERLNRAAAKALDEGALAVGMSLEYAPGISTDELIAVMRTAARYGAPVFFHLRYSDMEPPGTNIEALEEAIGAARATGASIHIGHINSTGGTFSMKESLSLLSRARVEGIDVTACAYPYAFWATYLDSARFDGGWQGRFRITYKDLQIGGTGERLDRESFSRYRKEGKLAIAYAIPEEDVLEAMKSPLVMIGSDGILTPGNNNHPRASGAFSRTIAVYVRELEALTLMQAIEKMTLMPARRLEARAPAFRRKGRIQAGADADIVVFDPMRVRDTSTVERPDAYAEGMDYVIVNGTIVKDPSGLRGGRAPGAALRAGQAGLQAR
jgi:dihydroorotase